MASRSGTFSGEGGVAGFTHRAFTKQHVNQAPLGCDFDFLRGSDPVEARESPKF